MLWKIIGCARAVWSVRKLKGGFDPMDLWWMGAMGIIAFFLLWFILSVVMPDLFHPW
jgi:hypothetical protein